MAKTKMSPKELCDIEVEAAWGGFNKREANPLIVKLVNEIKELIKDHTVKKDVFDCPKCGGQITVLDMSAFDGACPVCEHKCITCSDLNA